MNHAAHRADVVEIASPRQRDEVLVDNAAVGRAKIKPTAVAAVNRPPRMADVSADQTRLSRRRKRSQVT